MADAPLTPGSTWRWLGHHQMTVSSSVVDLTDSASYTIPPKAMQVRLQPSAGNLRYLHTSDVTANTGNIIYAGDVDYLPGVIPDIKLIRMGGSDVTLECSYEGYQ